MSGNDAAQQTTWVLVAHKSGARVYEVEAEDGGLQLLREFDHPEGRLKAQDVHSDRQGVTFESAGPGRHPKSAEQDAPDRIAEDFARELVHALDKDRSQGRFSSLILIAAPKLLGMLRHSISKPMQKVVATSIDKDLAHADEVAVQKLLERAGL